MFSDFFEANLIWFGMLLMLMVMLIIDVKKNSLMGAKKVSAAQLPIMQRDPTFLLDISAANEFSAGHIAGSINIPSATFSVDHKTFKAAKEDQVIVVDQTGLTTASIIKQIRGAGFSKVYALDGGIAAWRKDNFPLTTKRK